jgi:hypothetical protein
MRLYTICVSGRPTVVISVDADVDMVQGPPDVQQMLELREIEEDLDTWLGEELRRLKRNGKHVWNGDHSVISFREASAWEVS